LASEAFDPHEQRDLVTMSDRAGIERRVRRVRQTIGGDDRVVRAADERAIHGS
jgi:hypothetical protein